MRLSIAILSGVAAAVLSVLPLAWFWHGLRGGHDAVSWIALTVGVICGMIVRFTLAPDNRTGPSRWGWIMIAVFACASARAFLWLVYPVGNEWKILSPNNLGDLSLHLSFINWLSSTSHWWPGSPILAGDSLRYPLGTDLFNALLVVAGVPPIMGLIWCGLIGCALTGYALWRWGGAVALAALLFNGGVAGFILLKTGWGGNPDEVSEWKNLFLTVFVTQRGFLYALPAGFLLLTTWREESFGPEKKRVLPLGIQALLLGVVPLFSIHAALFLGAAMAGLALLSPSSRERIGRLALVAWPPMTLFGWMITTGAGGHSPMHAVGWLIGWMSDGTPWFWFWNFGMTLPIALLLCFHLFGKRESVKARAFVWPASLVFTACLFIRFAPWPWDNTKLMIWSWIVVAPFLWDELLARRSILIRACAAILLFGSGAVTLATGLDDRHGYTLIGRSTLDNTAWDLRGLPPEAVIACAPEYNQPVLMLGHPVVCGYEGHLWSHGLDYKKRLESLNSLMMGEPGWQEKASGLGVAYVYWGELERKRWPDSKLPWSKELTPSLHRIQVF